MDSDDGERLLDNIGMVYNYTTRFYTMEGRGEVGRDSGNGRRGVEMPGNGR